MKIYNVYQSGKRLYIDEKENPDNKIVVNKYDNMQQTLRLISDGTLPPRLYWALRNPKLSNKYFILKLANNEDLIVGTDISAYAGLWDMLLIGTDEDYIIEGADIDQSRLTYVSDHFGRLFVRDNFLEELDFEEQCSPTFKIFYDEIMFQLGEKVDTKDIPDKLSDFENDTNFISGFDTVEDGNGNVTIVSGVYGNFTFNIDSELSETSPRPVQNKVITSKINEIDDIVQENDRKADEALIIAKGANNSLVYGNYSTMITSLNAMQGENLKVGQNLLIVTLNVPDLWVSDVTDVYSNYEYVSDEQFVTDLSDGTVQVGYYVLSPLETQKVDLTDYVKKTDYASTSNYGVVKAVLSSGVGANAKGELYINPSYKSDVDSKSSHRLPIVPNILDYAVMKALTDSKNHEWTDDEKALACSLLNALNLANLGGAFRVASDGKLQLVGASKDKIQLQASSSTPIVPSTLSYAIKEGLANNKEEWSDDEKALARALLGAIGSNEYATNTKAGVVIANADNGLQMYSNGNIAIVPAEPYFIDLRTNGVRPITPKWIDYSVKKALSDCKLSGDYVWTDEEKASALALLGAISNTEVSTSAIEGKIVKRSVDGQINVPQNPQTDSHATSKKYVEDNFVPKSTALNQVYGSTTNYTISLVPLAYGVPRYSANATLTTSTPIADNDATTKKYVDDLVGSVETILTELHTYAQTKIGGET